MGIFLSGIVMVDRRQFLYGRRVRVSQHLLYAPCICAILHQMHGKGMTQAVGSHFFSYPRRLPYPRIIFHTP